MHLITAYYRGLLYLAAHKFVSRDANVRVWYSREFNVAYSTVDRYMFPLNIFFRLVKHLL